MIRMTRSVTAMRRQANEIGGYEWLFRVERYRMRLAIWRVVSVAPGWKTR
jgi:hypothetical protein